MLFKWSLTNVHVIIGTHQNISLIMESREGQSNHREGRDSRRTPWRERPIAANLTISHQVTVTMEGKEKVLR